MSRQIALVLSTDPLGAALLGAAIELSGHIPRFAQSDEPARAALLRIRPRLVIIDCDQQRVPLSGCRTLAQRWQAQYRTLLEFVSS